MLRGALPKDVLHLRAPPICSFFQFLFSFTRSLLFSSFPSTLFIRAFLCAAAPSSLLAESWKEIGKERARGGASKRAREGGGPRYGSDRVSALSEAFHHIFVAVCTPALQNPHSKLLLLCILPSVVLLQLILIVLHAAAMALLVNEFRISHVSQYVVLLSKSLERRGLEQLFALKVNRAMLHSHPGDCSTIYLKCNSSVCVICNIKEFTWSELKVRVRREAKVEGVRR